MERCPIGDWKGVPLSLNAQNNEEILEAETEVNSKMMRAYGAYMCEIKMATSSEWHGRWELIASTHNSQYILPSGAVGKEFLRVLAEEVRSVESGKEISERMLVFVPMVLQKDGMVKQGQDIKRLISGRLTMWRDGLFEELMFEFERCCSAGSRKQRKRNVDERERINRIFTRSMLRGQVKAAMQWLTEPEVCKAARRISHQYQGRVEPPFFSII